MGTTDDPATRWYKCDGDGAESQSAALGSIRQSLAEMKLKLIQGAKEYQPQSVVEGTKVELEEGWTVIEEVSKGARIRLGNTKGRGGAAQIWGGTAHLDTPGVVRGSGLAG